MCKTKKIISNQEKTIHLLEGLLADYLNKKITKKELRGAYTSYCGLRDM